MIHYLKKNQLVRFLFVGVLNTLFGYSIFVLLSLGGISYYLSTLLATILGVLFNFKTIGKLVFKNHDNKLIFSFIAVYTVIYLLNITSLKLILAFGINILIAQAGLVLPLALVSYFLNKTFVFKQP